jgi:uncharacterized protein
MSWIEITALIISGLLVGFINTLAGGGSIISLSLLMFLGLPVDIANGTNRISVTIQTLTSVLSFRYQKVLPLKKGLLLGIPVIFGSILGAFIAIEVNKNYVEKAFGIVMIIMFFMVLTRPSKWLHGQEHLINKPLSIWKYLLFFILGIYGGFIHVGIGYFLLAAVVLGAGYNLVNANAIKVLIVLMYVPFTLIVFLINDKINWEYGLIHSIGNVAGAWIGARYAVSWGAKAVRWIMISIIIVSVLHVFNLIDFQKIYETII